MNDTPIHLQHLSDFLRGIFPSLRDQAIGPRTDVGECERALIICDGKRNLLELHFLRETVKRLLDNRDSRLVITDDDDGTRHWIAARVENGAGQNPIVCRSRSKKTNHAQQSKPTSSSIHFRRCLMRKWRYLLKE